MWPAALLLRPPSSPLYVGHCCPSRPPYVGPCCPSRPPYVGPCYIRLGYRTWGLVIRLGHRTWGRIVRLSHRSRGLDVRLGCLLEVGRLLDADAGTGLHGLLCRLERRPACLAATTTTTLGAPWLCGRLPEMTARSSVLLASCRWAQSFSAAQSIPGVMQELA